MLWNKTLSHDCNQLWIIIMGNLMFFFVLDIFGGRKGLSSNKKLNPTSFSAAFSAFQLWSFDVLFDFPVIVYFSP